MFIKVWCEYDLSGAFGGCNNEDVFEVSDNFDRDFITGTVTSLVVRRTGVSESDLEGLFSWEYVEIEKLF